MATGFTLDELNAMAAQPQQASRGYSLEELDALATQSQTAQKGYSLAELEAMSAPPTPEAPTVTQEAPVVQAQAPVVEQAPPTQATQVAAQVQPTAPQEYPPYEPVQPELTAYTPSFIDRVGRMLGLGPNRDRASVELAARQIAKEQGMSVGEVYKQAGGSRGIFNPEGRATLPAIGEAAVVAGQSAQDIPSAFANTALRAIRGGDISGGESSFLDYAIKQTETPDRKVDKNYEDLGGLGKSLGYSFATMGASILAAAGAGLVTANPLVGGAAMLGTSGTVSYRASKDEFLDRVKTQLNNKTKQLYGRELTKDEWQSVRGDFESAAKKFGAWEAIPEAVGNMFMVKAFSAPAKGMTKPALNKLVERTASIGVENIGETATGVGQRQAEIEAGLSKEELSVKDAFKQQFLSTMLLGGTMAAGAKGSQMATDFYQKYVEPRIDPQSALGRAIMADLENAVVNPQGVDAQAISALQGAEAPTLAALAEQKDAQEQKKIEPTLSPNVEPPEEEMITSTAPGISVSYPRERAEPTFTVDPETGEVLPITPVAQETQESNQLIEQRALELRQTNGYPAEVALSVARREYAEGDLNVDESRTGVDAGRTEPSISMPVEGAASAQGVTPSDTSGLADTVGDTRGADVGERAERTALDESLIPTLTERAPAPTPAATYAELPAEDKAPVLQEAQQMWEAGEANLPMAKAWNSLPSWKRDMFAAQVYENYDEITTNPEAFRAAIDKVVEAKKPAEAKVEAKEPVVAESVVETPVAPVLSAEDQARLQSAQRNAAEAQATLDFLADRGFTTPEQNYGVEAAQNKLAKAQETINQFEPPVETVAPIVQQAQAKLADAEAAVAAATTPEAKKEATAQRNAARQEVKKVEAVAPVDAITTPTAPKRGRPAKPVVEGAEPKTPKPRGRKKIQLTPEEQALKDAERGVNQAEAIKAARDVDKLIKFLSSEFDPANTKSPDFTKVATQGLDSVRREYIYKLNEFATKNAYRTKPASGGKARDFLASSDKITQKERADLQTRLEFEKTRPPKPSAARSRSTEKPVKAFYEFDRASQAIDYIMRNGTPFERALAARLKPLVGDVRLTVADTKENTPDAIQDLLGDAAGVYSSSRWGDKVHRMIVLRGENFDDPALQGVNNIIFLHEALHAATEAKIDQWQELTSLGLPVPPQLQMLVNDLFEVMGVAQAQYEALKASGQPISANLRHKMEKLDITNDPKEFVTYGMTDPDVQRFLLNAPGYTRKDQALGYIKNLFNQFVNSIRRSFNMDAKHQSALQDLVLVTEGLMQEQEIEPAYSVNTVLEAKQEKVDKNLEKIRLSNSASGMVDPIEKNVKAGHTYNDFNDLLQARLDAMGNGFIKKTLATLQTADIIRWQGDAIPALKSIDSLVEKMAGSRMNMERAFTKKADQFARFVRKAGKKKQLLADAMHLARLNSVSPSLFKDRADALATDKRMVQLDKLLANPSTSQEELPTINSKRTIRKKQINQTFDAWEKLGTLQGGQDMYRMVRQFYKDANVLTRTLLDERIERLNVEGSIDDPSTPKGKLMLAVRRMQEDSDFKGIDEYFPFMRYGDFWLRVNGPQGREFYLFESGTERNAFLNRRAKELGIDPNVESDTFDAGDDLTALRTKYSPESKMLADMFEIIDNEMDKPGVDRDALKDALYQTYLMTLPEESYRKQFLHSENVTGFSSDVFRNFTTSASRIASQSAKLAYGDQIGAEVQRARDTLKGMPALKKAKLELFVNEISGRVEDELNPPPESKAVIRLNQFAYYSLLTGVASAITQTTALPMLVMPVLNQEYGYGSSAAKFAKYMALWQSVGVTQEGADGEVVYVAPTMGESSIVKNNPILQRAFQEAIDRGLTSQTNSSVLTNRNRTPDSAYANIPQAALRTTATMMSSLFTGAERMTREMAYLMTFELEYAKTKDFDASVQKAVDTVQELLGRYDAFNRPRIMRNVVGRTVGQFKMYAVNITSFFVRNGYNMATQIFKGNPKEALNAMHRLGGALTMAAVFGGVTTFPMYSVVTSVIDLILDAFGDDEEKKRRMAENPYTATSSDLRFRYEFLPQMFGDIKITGLDGKPRTLAAVLEKGAISELGDFNIGSRTTYDGMWFRDAKPGNTTQETVVNYLVANLGPAVSSGLSMTGAVDDFSNGKIARGLERIAPAMFKNPLTAARLGAEGAKTPAGDVVMSKDEFSSFNLAMQSLGFQSTALARYQENKYKIQQETVAATKTRSDILGKLDNAVLGSDASDKDLERVFERIDKFNDRFVAMKHLRIDSDTIKRVVDRAKDKERFMFRGMYIRKEDLPYLLELRDTTERPRK
jgi:hypothetical protein